MCEAREPHTPVREEKVSPQSRSLFSTLFETFCLTARAYLNTQKYGLFCSLKREVKMVRYGLRSSFLRSYSPSENALDTFSKFYLHGKNR